MQTKTKQGLAGTIVLQGNNVIIIKNDNNRVFYSFLDVKTARDEFNRLTQSYRGCGKKREIHKTPQAKIHYAQLIIQC